MQTKLSKKYGADKTVDEFIDLAGRNDLASPESVIQRAHELSSKLGTYYPLKPASQKALAFLWSAYIDRKISPPVGEIGKLAAAQHVRKLMWNMRKLLATLELKVSGSVAV